MLSGTDCFQDRLIEQHIPKGEDRGKPSLKRTIREDMPDAYRAKAQEERNEGKVQTKNTKQILRTSWEGEGISKSNWSHKGGSLKTKGRSGR